MTRVLRYPPILVAPLVLGCTLGPGVARAQATPALSYFTVVPCRVLDTRKAETGGPAPLLAGSRHFFQVPASCGVPDGARAVAANLTVTTPTGAGHLSTVQSWTQVPTTSVLNYGQGRTQANHATIALVGSRVFGVSIHQPTGGSVHLVVDVTGYYMPAACAATPDLAAPGLTIALFPDAPVLMWDPVPGATSYNLYLKEVADFDADDAIVTRSDTLVAGAISPVDVSNLACDVVIIADATAVNGECETPLRSEQGGSYQVGWWIRCGGAEGVSRISLEPLPRRSHPTVPR